MAPRLLRTASLCASLLLGLSTSAQAVPFSRRAQTSKGLQTEHCDVAVVGGGAGGANTAVFLKDKGYKVCLFEAQPLLGGHCNTVRYGPNPQEFVDVGVVVYGNSSYWKATGLGNWTLSTDTHIKRFAPPGTILGLDFSGASTPTFIADLKQGVGPFAATGTPEQVALIGQAIGEFTSLLADKYPWIETSGAFPDPIPAELLQPFSTFLELHPQFLPLAYTVFSILLYQGGMGPYDQLSTFYALLNLRRGNLFLSLPTKSALLALAGCQSIYDGIQAYLGDGVYLEAQVLSIDRPKDGQQNKRTKLEVVFPGNQIRKFTADKVIMAIPQTLQNLAVLEPDARETSAFGDVKVRGYYAFTVDIAGGALPDTPGGFELLNRNLSAGLNQDPLPLPPSVTLISRQSAQGPASAYAVSESPLSTTQALAAITEQLDHVPPSAIENVTLNKFNNHIFQPHFPTEALARSPSPYTIINGIQGYRNTYYVGALFSFAESAKIMEHAYVLVNNNF